MRKFRLTGLFLIVASLIFVAVAVAINFTTTRSEEKQIVSATTSESINDAKVVARIVTKLLDSTAVNSKLASTKISEPISPVNIVEFLSDSEIVGLNLYSPDGSVVWSSSLNQTTLGSRQQQIFDETVDGMIASGLVRDSSVSGPAGEIYDADVVETYVPISDFETGAPALVLGVTRDVTTALATSIDQSRSAVFQSTMTSLGIGFVVLLLTVFIADVRMWNQQALAIAHEKEKSSYELSVAKLNLANRELRLVGEERRKILSTVSHELKTPLFSIIAYTDILSRNQAGERMERNLEHLSNVKRSSNHLLSLINDLLSSNRMNSIDSGLRRQDFQIEDLLQELKRTMNPILAAKQQTLYIKSDEVSHKVRLDRRRMLQGLMNLVSNSSKFSSDGSLILVESNIVEQKLRFLVADPGIGIAEEDLEALFTNDNENAADGEINFDNGHRMGLRITQQIVEAHGGHMVIQSKEGHGTRVFVIVPTGFDSGVGNPAAIDGGEANPLLA